MSPVAHVSGLNKQKKIENKASRDDDCTNAGCGSD
jgi:hypothetical protein